MKTSKAKRDHIMTTSRMSYNDDHLTGLGLDNMKRSDVVNHYRIKRMEKKIASQQAKIDSLMLEYCPDEMTEEQVKNWEDSQVNSDIGAGSGG